MRVRKLITERFQDYKLPCMYLATCFCDWKCCPDNPSICQNSPIAKLPILDIPDDEILDQYLANPITSAIVIAGLEPLFQLNEVVALIKRAVERNIQTTFVIYTGYDKDEVRFAGVFDALHKAECDSADIIIKYGRYHAKQQPHFDPVLGVDLASDNQYAERIRCNARSYRPEI